MNQDTRQRQKGQLLRQEYFDAQHIAPTNQYVKQYPLGREPIFRNDEFVRIRVKAGTTVNAICYITFEV